MSKYWAFISYSHKDEERGKWGSWLHKSLERYRVPRQLVGRDLVREHVPKRLYPIFRDEEELPGTPNLTQKITEALSQSRYLIVIFSPDAVVFVIEYDDRRGELWSGRDGAKVADLGLSVEGSKFDPEGSRAVLWHTNGWGYLLDVDWLSDMAGRAATPTPGELLDILCEGPLASGLLDVDALRAELDGRAPVACRQVGEDAK